MAPCVWINSAAASGIGREIARAFRESGAAVFVCDIDAKALDALKQEIPGVATGVCERFQEAAPLKSSGTQCLSSDLVPR